MPAIADPYSGHPLTGHADTSRRPTSDHSAHSLRLRLRTSLHREELTRELAYGTGSAQDDVVKVGVLVGSLVAALIGAGILVVRGRWHARQPG